MKSSIAQSTFLSTLACNCPAGTHLLVVEAGPKGFPARRYVPGQRYEGSFYVCIGASRSARRRRREDIATVRALVIDDVGTKVDAKRVKLEPSWKIETSKGNWQYGYLLDWCQDLDAFDALNDALAAAGLQDAGAKGVNRVVRIPGSVNQKEGRAAFAARVPLFCWHPKRVFTLEDLSSGLKVTPGAKAKAAPVIDRGTQGMPDPVFDWLMERGHVRGEKSDGWWEIDCPFAGEHLTDARDEAAYKPLGADARGTRGVKCFHTHGDVAGFSRRFLDWVAAEGGPAVEVSADKELAAAAIERLVKVLPALTGAPYDHATLRAALGEVPKRVLPDLDLGTKGAPLKLQPLTHTNVLAALRHLGITLRHNLMTHKLDYALPARVDRTRVPSVDLLLEVVCDICSGAGMRSSRGYAGIINALAQNNVYHPMREWIESAPWDGRDHFKMLLASVQTPTPELFALYLRRWLIQCVEAVCGYERERQKAAVLVLVGPQGIGKTRWLMSLAPGYSKEGAQLHLSGYASRDTMHEALSCAIVELGELEITFGKSESGALKNFLSRTNDMYRLPYGDKWTERPRATSFCGSVNDRRFLVDATGSRRFWPVEVTRCFVDHGVNERELWAQAHTWWAAGERCWLDEAEDKLREQAAARFAQPDEVSQMLRVEIVERYPELEERIACGLNITQIHRLARLPCDRRSLSLGSQVLSDLLNEKPRDLRNYGGAAEAWVWPVTSEEKKAFKLAPLKPGYRPTPPPAWLPGESD